MASVLFMGSDFCLFMFSIDPTKIFAYFNILMTSLLNYMHWRVSHFFLQVKFFIASSRKWLCFKNLTVEVTRHSWQRCCIKWKRVLLNQLSFFGVIFIHWNYWWKMIYWFLNIICHLRWSFVQQLDGETLHFSLHLWTAMNANFAFFMFCIDQLYFYLELLSFSDLNYGQWITQHLSDWRIFVCSCFV